MYPEILKKTGVTQFLELFLSLVQSGFSVTAALRALSKEKGTGFYAIKISMKIGQSRSFSKALCTISRKLKPYAVLLMSAEETGDITLVLKGVVEDLKEQEKDLKNLIASLIYPLFICIMALALSGFLISYGIPFINLISQVNEKQMIKAVITANIWLVLASLITVCLIRFFSHKHDFCYALFQNLYHLNLNNIGMEETFLLLLRQKDFKKKDLKCISHILSGLRAGKNISDVCRLCKRFDIYALSWLFAAEQSGDVTKSLEKIYEYYKEKRRVLRENIRRFLEPVLLAVCGGYVVILIAGLVVPIFMNLGTKLL